MPQRVGTDVGAGTGAAGVFLHQVPDHDPRKGRSPAGDEEPIGFRPPRQPWALIRQIRLDRRPGHGVERDDPLLVSLSEAAAKAFLEMDVVQTDPGCLGGPAAGRVQEAQQSAVAERIAVFGRGSRQDAVDRFGAEHFRQVLPQLGRTQKLDSAFGQHAVEHEIPKEHFQRNEMPSHGGGCQLAMMQMIEIARRSLRSTLKTEPDPLRSNHAKNCRRSVR